MLESRDLLSGYTFVKITDSVGFTSLGDQVALGNNGEVAFKGATSAEQLVLKGSGGALATIASDAGDYAQFGDPSINAAGQVAFWALLDDPILQVIGIGSGNTPVNVVTATSAAQTGDFEQLDRKPDINDDGDLAFVGDTPETTGVYHRSASGVVTPLVAEADGYSPFALTETFVSLSNSDRVSFNANLTSGDKAIVLHTGPGGSHTNLRDSGGVFNSFTRTSVSGDGDVATGVTYDAGAEPDLLFLSDAGLTQNFGPRAAETAYANFDAPNLINNVGGVVFLASLDGGGQGIFTGDNPSTDKVIQTGDTLDGSTVNSIQFTSNGANASGQVAFFVTLADGRSAIFRADPIPPPQVDWGDLPESATAASSSGYKTTSAKDGPSHVIVQGLSLGVVDAEADGQPNATASGDDTNGVDDEDSALFLVTSTRVERFYNSSSSDPLEASFPGRYELTVQFTASVAATNETGGPAYLYAFADLTRDGDFDDPGETLIHFVPDGSEDVEFRSDFTMKWDVERDLGVPISATYASNPNATLPLNLPFTFAVRHRLSTSDELNANGPAPDGEVEDDLFAFQVITPDILPRYFTTTSLNSILPTIPGTLQFTATVKNDSFVETTPTGSVDFLSIEETALTAVGADAGQAPTVTLFDQTGAVRGTWDAFPASFLGGVRVALGDVNGDGVAELIAAPGPGGDNKVKIVSMSSGGDSELEFSDLGFIPVADQMIGSGGLRVAAGDVNGDGLSDIIVSGGPKVLAYSGEDFSLLHELTPFGTTGRDLRIAVGDVNGDGNADIVVATGSNVASAIKVFDVFAGGNVIRSFAPFESTFRGGVHVAVGDVTGDGLPDLVASKGAGSTPQAKVFSGPGLGFFKSFMGASQSFLGGIRVSVSDLNGDDVREIIVSPEAAVGGSSIWSFNDQAANFEQQSSGPLANTLQGVRGFIGSERSNVEIELGMAPLDTQGVATFSTSEIEDGLRTFVARYNGTPIHRGSTSGRQTTPVSIPVPLDFGDAPASYDVAVEGSARHGAGGPKLGELVDLELTGNPSANALGDDSTATDDEDGVTFLSNLLFSQNDAILNTFVVTASQDGFLAFFIDYNHDGQFDRTTESHYQPVRAGENRVSFLVPPVHREYDPRDPFSIGRQLADLLVPPVQAGETFARFRISSAPFVSDPSVFTGLVPVKPTGLVPDGEVEDYVVTLQDVSLGSSSGVTSVQLPTPSQQDAAAMHEISVANGILTLAGFSSGGDRAPLLQMPFDGRQRIEIMGTPGDDLLRLDLSGSDVTMQDFHFDGGGEATAAGDGIEIIGGDRQFSEVGVSYDAFEDGMIIVGQSRIQFTDLEPIFLRADSETAFVRFDSLSRLTNAIAEIDVGTELTTFSGTIQREVGGVLSDRREFESVTFRTPSRRIDVFLTTGHDVLTVSGGFSSEPTRSLVLQADLGPGNDRFDMINVAPTKKTVSLDTGVAGNTGDDTILAGNGNDTLLGQAGNDLIETGAGTNIADGGSGNDIVRGGDGSDSLLGSAGNDLIQAGAGNDTLDGGAGNDQLYGENDDDIIRTGADGDTADGGSGNDFITGDSGAANANDPIDVLIGGSGNDTLEGTDVEDELNGGEGNDVLIGFDGDDVLRGGSGDDRVDGGLGEDQVSGNEGNDVLNGQDGDDLIDGGSGNDSLDGGKGQDDLRGRDGDDQLTGGDGHDILQGDDGADTLFGGDGDDLLRGGLGNDVLTDDDGNKTAGADTLYGDAGNDILSASLGNDVLQGGTGDDQLDGGVGADTISGEDGNDTIFGGEDNDSLNGGSGTDQISGGGGEDSASGGDGDDRLFGDAGNDALQGDEGRDHIDGGLGNDILQGGEDHDTIRGGQGNDVIAGDEDNDSLNGGDGNDTVSGGDDDDTVVGGTGDDSVSGDDGDDRVLGQAGNDTVSTGEGVDTIDGGTGSDVISEFVLNATLTSTRLTLVNLDGDTEIEVLRGIERASLSAAFASAGVMLNASAFRGAVTLFGSGFNDTITGGNGADLINGGAGNDSILGGSGNDSIQGDAGNDTIRGGLGNDVLKGGADNDQLFGERGHDLLNGGSGNDLLEGDLAADTVPGVAGNDSLTGQDGDDTLRGFAGNDVLVGGNGKDNLDGGLGNDTLLGGADNDTIIGGAGTDVAAGGPGTNNITTVETINELFTFPGGLPAWVDEI